MSVTTTIRIDVVPGSSKELGAIARERGAQKLVSAFILSGLLFMLLPGTFLGVWNLISISESRTVTSLSPAWIQAHGHAQVFGWIGSFILGIGFYSLQKLLHSPLFPLWRGWTSWILWTAGVALRWTTNIYLWHWRALLPLSALMELGAFLIFFFSVRTHRRAGGANKRETWTILVMASTLGFLASLLANAVLAVVVSSRGAGPALAHAIDQRFLVLCTWGFLVPAIWGFNTKWLPVFLGLRPPIERWLLIALAANTAGVAAALPGFMKSCVFLLLCGAVFAGLGLRIFEPPAHPAKTLNVHRSFPFFVRAAYFWLSIAAVLGVWAAGADRFGGIWGASRHALTVGFLATMVFAIGQRVLPAFCGMKILRSPRVMLWSLLLLNLGCTLRVFSEFPAYEGYWRGAWHVLPISAVIELVAVALFAWNIAATILLPGRGQNSQFPTSAGLVTTR